LITPISLFTPDYAAAITPFRHGRQLLHRPPLAARLRRHADAAIAFAAICFTLPLRWLHCCHAILRC